MALRSEFLCHWHNHCKRRLADAVSFDTAYFRQHLSRNEVLMQPKKLQEFKERLLSMRRRVTGEVEHMIESIQEEANQTGNVSNIPVHFGDLAVTALEADVRVLETEQSILEEIEAALARVEQGNYGLCLACGSPIADERLDSLPQTPMCISCANTAQKK